MATAALVNLDIENGERIVKALDEDGKSPNVAIWAKLPEYESWRLILASEHLEQQSALGYGQINAALRKANFPISRKPAIYLRPMSSPMIAALRKIFGGAADVYGMRLGGQTFGDKYIEDAFVYRIH
jgi:hypothetical protein